MNRWVGVGTLLVAAALLNGACSAKARVAVEAPSSQNEAAATASPIEMPSSSGGSIDISMMPKTIGDAEASFESAEKELTFALKNQNLRAEPLEEGVDRCTIVCKALSSMRYSAKRICELAPDRCDAATERVKRAEERAKESCTACATPT